MNYLDKIVEDIELHSVEGIRECFLNGIHPNDHFRNEPLINELTSEYTRSPRFRDCVKVFVDFGLEMADQLLLAILLDDPFLLETQLQVDPAGIHRKITMRCAYTPLYEASPLHVCAEFNQLACAEMLLKYGADVNASAGKDADGFGGQTPIFHTVNQNSNQSADVMELLLANDADLHLTVAGITWGKGYEWETLIPSVNPISYAMMGLLPQIHRNEKVISGVVVRLLKKAYNIDYQPVNVPCAYLK
jgi:hypothetical protein